MAKRSNESECWQYIEKAVAGKAKCKLFPKSRACAGGSTTGLMAHVRSVHADAMINTSPRQPKLSSFGVGSHCPYSESHQEQITGLIGDVIVSNMLPVSLVESAEFRALLAFLEPAYATVSSDDDDTAGGASPKDVRNCMTKCSRTQLIYGPALQSNSYGIIEWRRWSKVFSA